MDNMPQENPMLGRTMDEGRWEHAQEIFKQKREDVLVWDFQDGWQFWVVSHNGLMARKTVYKDREWIVVMEQS